MSTDLCAICNALSKCAECPKEFDEVILQFINSIQIDAVTLSHLENDPYLSRLINYIFSSITRYQLSQNCTGQTYAKTQQMVDFLLKISVLNPSLLNIIALHAPFEELIFKFFKESAFDKKKKLLPKPQLEIFIKFIALLSSESGISLGSTEAFSLLFAVCETYFNEDGIAEYALSTIAGFLRNCSSGISFVRSQTKFGKLKTIFASLLSSKNAAVVLAALADLVFLFPSQIAPNISVQTAINALGISETFYLAPKISSWIIEELSEAYTLTSNDVWSILSTAITGGPKAYYLYQLLTNNPENYQTIIDVISSMNCLFLIINSILDAQEAFISIAGCTFLNSVFHNGSDIVFSSEVTEPFTHALKIAVAPSKFIETDKKEAAVVILRFLVRSRESTCYVVKLLKEYQQKLFLDFQRQVESNNSYLAVQYFLFLFEVSHFIEEWHHMLARIVLDSQLPVLVIHVINESTNKYAIEDGLTAMQIITGGMKDDTAPERNVLFNTIIEGHMISNKISHDGDGKDNARIEQITKELMTQVSELEVEKDCCMRELESLKSDAVKCSMTIEAELNTHQDVEEEKEKLQAQDAQIKKELADKKKALEERLGSNKVLQQEVAKLQKLSTTKSVREAGIRAKSNDIDQITKTIEDTEARNAKIEEEIKNLIASIEKQKSNRVKYIKWLKSGKTKIEENNTKLNEVIEQLSIEHERNAQMKNDLSLAEEQIKQLSDMIKEDQSQKKLEEQEIQNLKNEIEQVLRDREANQYKATLKLKALDQLKEHMLELESQNNEAKLLIKLLHKSTYPNMKIPENVSSLFNLQASGF